MNADRSLGLWLDDAAHRLILIEHVGNDLVAMGFDCRDDASRRRQVEPAQGAGYAVVAASPAERPARRNDVVDVGRALERAAALRVPISLDLGQHPHPDGTFAL